MEWILAVLGTGIFPALFLLERYRRRTMEKRMDELVNLLEHFLLEGEKNLETSLREGKLENLGNRLADMEDYILHIKKSAGERETRLNHFMENMAHQMKTSLTALQIRVDLTRLKAETEVGDGVGKGILEELAKCQKCLLRLSGEVERILECSRLADQKISMQRIPCRVEELLANALSDLEPLRQKRNVTVTCKADPLPAVSLDHYWFGQALENVLKNALEHTKPESEVMITVQDQVKLIVIRVADQGPGILPAELPYLFQRFHRGSHTKAGYGIGLSMAKDILKAHHGNISVQSPEGKGACFTLELPVLEGERPYEEMPLDMEKGKAYNNVETDFPKIISKTGGTNDERKSIGFIE